MTLNSELGPIRASFNVNAGGDEPPSEEPTPTDGDILNTPDPVQVPKPEPTDGEGAVEAQQN